MKQITDIDEGTVRRIDWVELVPPTLFFRAFSATFKPTFLAICACIAALCAPAFGFYQVLSDDLCDGGRVFRFSFEYLTWRGEGSPYWLLYACVGGFVGLILALAISRATVVRLTSSARSSTVASLKFAIKKIPSLVLPFALPVIVLFAFYIGLICVGKLGVFGEICAPLTVLFVVASVLLLAIFTVAFPMAVTAVAAENCDCFDAISRGISYTTQRLLFWCFYMAFGVILTVLGYLICEAVIGLCVLGFDSVYYPIDTRWLSYWRMTLLWTPAAYVLLSAVVYTNAAYILLRRSVDGTPFDSCALDLTKTKPRQLREVLLDGKGAPELDKAFALQNGGQTPEKKDA